MYRAEKLRTQLEERDVPCEKCQGLREAMAEIASAILEKDTKH